jgi:hypothetical protein
MKKIRIQICFYCLLLTLPLRSQKYVATDGSDANPGTFGEPFVTLSRAISDTAPGDTIWVSGGVYPSDVTLSIGSSRSGSEAGRRCLFAYPGERPLLDFSATTDGAKGISLKADYWHIRGFDVFGASDNGMHISGGSFNIIEFCSFYGNGDSGLQLDNGASGNQIINCDSYQNADPPDYGDADGFAPKLSVGGGNAFSGCRAWENCDDGWDGYLRGSNDVTTTLEKCWTWSNGYLKDGSDPGPQANGNGFKMGGGDDGNSLQLMHHFILKRCLSFGNKGKGFDQNNNAGSTTLLNCTAYGDRTSNYRIQRTPNIGQAVVIQNCVSFGGAVELGGFAVQERNSWMPAFVVTAEDFLSVDPSNASAPRKADGSLPDMDFVHPAPGSDLVDAGVDLGFSFSGNGPDLGAFESSWVSQVENPESVPSGFDLCQNYPNPFNPSTSIRYFLSQKADIRLTVCDLQGRQVALLVHENQRPGEHIVLWRGVDDNGRAVASGIYFYRLVAGNAVRTGKALLAR